jgi:hypothetical protein
MTLIISEVSNYGIAMVGDSAITYSDIQNRERAKTGASKIQYSDAANIGFGVWGNALICGQQIDQWLHDFIHDHVSEGSRLDDIGDQLAENLRYGFRFDGRSWNQLKCGIHLAGYLKGLPRLWHVHMGHADEEPHEPRLYRDFPEGKGWEDDYLQALFSEGGVASFHLRGGYIPHYALLFDQTAEYSDRLRSEIGISFPANSLRGHLEFQKVLVKFVAGVLVAAEAHPGVDANLSAVAFDRDGIQIDERLPVARWYTAHGEHAMRSVGLRG